MPDTKNSSKTYLFIDESGDPTFYASRNRCIVGTEGFKPLLLIGMVKLEDKRNIRKAIEVFMAELVNDPLYNTLHCITDPKGWYLHACLDNLEVRVRFIGFLRKLEGFKFYCVIGRKRLDVFHKKHNKNETEFYFDMVYHLLKDRLNKTDTFYQVFLSVRNKSTQHRLKEAIDNALLRDNDRRKSPIEVKYNSELVSSKDTPELSIADYMLWVLQRYILQGDKRFYNVLADKFNLIIDLYDFDKYKVKGMSNYYHAKNKFEVEKASAFRLDGYIQ